MYAYAYKVPRANVMQIHVLFFSETNPLFKPCVTGQPTPHTPCSTLFRMLPFTHSREFFGGAYVKEGKQTFLLFICFRIQATLWVCPFFSSSKQALPFKIGRTQPPNIFICAFKFILSRHEMYSPPQDLRNAIFDWEPKLDKWKCQQLHASY